MSRVEPPTVVIVPGLRDHVADHWQTLLAERMGDTRTVPPVEHDKLNCAVRVAALEQVLAGISGPVILVAHSAGVVITVQWAQRHTRAIEGALLATPPDFDSPLPEGYPTLEDVRHNGWTPTPCAPLPFPSIAVASTNDPLARFERVAEMAGHWGSRFVNAGAVGHLNPAAGYGRWSQGEELVHELIRSRQEPLTKGTK